MSQTQTGLLSDNYLSREWFVFGYWNKGDRTMSTAPYKADLYKHCEDLIQYKNTDKCRIGFLDLNELDQFKALCLIQGWKIRFSYIPTKTYIAVPMGHTILLPYDPETLFRGLHESL